MGERIFETEQWPFEQPDNWLACGPKGHCKISKIRCPLHSTIRLGLVADPVIEAIARPEFEDGLRTGVHHGGCWGP